MLANVTQKMALRIVPVNDPLRDKWGQAGYRAYVTYANDDADHRLMLAALEPKQGYASLNVGYGTATTTRMAVLNAIDNYIEKFGPLCVADTDNVA